MNFLIALTLILPSTLAIPLQSPTNGSNETTTTYIPFLPPPTNLTIPPTNTLLSTTTNTFITTLISEFESLLFGPLSTFLQHRASKSPSNLIWTSNGCTKSPDHPLSWNFLPSCQRHDFGYRNYKKRGQFTAANKRRVDANFYTDLKDECGKHWLLSWVACRGAAKVYYAAVRMFGGETQG